MKKVNVCANSHLFVKSENGRTAVREGGIAFVTEEGLFAALGHREKEGDVPYVDSDVYTASAGDAVGRVLHSTEFGVYGAIYEGADVKTYGTLEIGPLAETEVGPAELIMPMFGKAYFFHGKIVALQQGRPHPVIFEADGETFPGASFGCSGGVVLQNGKVVAVVAGGDEVPAFVLYCTSAEQMLNDLHQMCKR